MVDLRDSTTYQLILEEGMVIGKAHGKAEGKAEGKVEGKVEGKAEGARQTLLRVGRRRFGSPTAAEEETLNAINDMERLDRMGEQVLDVGTWQELLSTP